MSFSREREVRRLMREFGLTREEAEGLLKYGVEHDNSGRQFQHVVKPKPVEEDPALDVLALAGLFLTGLVGVATLVDLYMKYRRKRRKREEEEWVV